MAVVYVESDLSGVISDIEKSDTLAVDLETTGLNPHDSRILLCQIGTGPTQWVIDVQKLPIEPLLPYLTSYKWLKLFHNEKFEQKFFQYYYKTRILNTWDVYSAELVLYPDSKSAGLDDLAFKYLGVVLDKRIRKSFVNHKGGQFSQEQIEYAASDVDVLFGIMEAQKPLIEERNARPILDIEFPLGGVIADMENVGVPINKELWKSKIGEFRKLHGESWTKLNDLILDSGKVDEQMGLFGRASAVNLNSPLQIKKAFKNAFNIDMDSTSERIIALIKHPAAQELLNYRGYEKLLSSYGSSFIDKIHPFTGRLHADWQQLGAGTGRFSCREPNMQQIPESLRECVQADEKSILVICDYSQIELRIIAQLSDDPNLLNAFNSGQDLHQATAALMFGISLDHVSKQQRFMAKTINFGIAYGMGIGKLKDTLNAEANKNKTPNLTFPQIKDLQNRHARSFRRASEWLKEAGLLAYRQAYSETMTGRKRFYNRPVRDELDEETFTKRVEALKRQGANGPVQGTSADITKMAMNAIYDEIQDAGYSANIILQVHDEIVVLAQKSQAEAVKTMLEETMRKTAEKIITKVPVKADATLSSSWKK